MAITIPILTDFNGSGIDRGIAQFQRLEGTGAKAGFLLRKAALPAAAALGAVAVGAKVAVGAASDMNETLSKTEVLFGSSAGIIKQWSTTTAGSLGIGRQEALNAATTFATFGKAAGLTGTELAKFSTDFTGLAGDLASFNNTTPEQAIQAIGAALRGESEPLRSYGVLLDDASMRQEAVRLGLIKTTKEALTPQNKVLAAQALIYKQTKDAQGDFSRTSDSAANRQKILRARLDDLTASLGQALLPVVETVTGLLAKLAGWFSENQGVAKVLIGTVAGLSAAILIANGVMKAAAVIMATLRAAQLALNLVMAANPVGIFVTALGLLVAGLVTAWNTSDTFRDAVKGVFDAVQNVVDFLKPIGSAAFDGLKLAFNAVKSAVEPIVGIVKNAYDNFKTVYNFLQPIARGVFDGIKGAFDALDGPINAVKSALKFLNDNFGVVDLLKGIARAAFAPAVLAFRALTKGVEALAAALRTAKALWEWFKSQIQGEGGNPFAPGGSLAGPVGTGTRPITGSRSMALGTVPTNVGTAATGGVTFVINVEAGIVSTPDQVGQQIIQAIQRAQRRSGPAFVAA